MPIFVDAGYAGFNSTMVRLKAGLRIDFVDAGYAWFQFHNGSIKRGRFACETTDTC